MSGFKALYRGSCRSLPDSLIPPLSPPSRSVRPEEHQLCAATRRYSDFNNKLPPRGVCSSKMERLVKKLNSSVPREHQLRKFAVHSSKNAEQEMIGG
jgi:hypothetical protein